MKDYYETLGVDRKASQDDIKSTYRKLAMKYHPDRNQGNKEAEQKFKDISNAYQVLSDPARRKAYDEGGEEGVRDTGFTEYADTDEILRQFSDLFGGAGFGTRFHRGGPVASAGEDIEARIRVDFRTAALGGKVPVRLSGPQTCDVCGGAGTKTGRPAPCKKCGGTGRATSKRKADFFSVTRPCPACHGSGIEPGFECPQCGGKGTIDKVRTVEVKIPEGSSSGQILRLKGLGSAGEHGGPAGDLLLELQVEDDPEFKREGNDILSDVKVLVWIAVLGGKVTVKTLRGSADVKIPASTASDSWLRLKGQGIRGGDHRLRVVISVPPHLTDKQKELVREASGL